MITEVLLDMDGVLVNFIEGTLALHEIEVNPYSLPENHGSWDVDKMIGISYQDMMSPMTVEFWRDLNWMPDGPDILRTIEKKFGRENVCLLSNPSASSKAMEGKLLWIERHIPDYRNRFLFGPSKQFAGHHARLLIDDSDSNIKQYACRKTKTKYPSILVPRLWNRMHWHESPLEHLEHHLEKLDTEN